MKRYLLSIYQPHGDPPPPAKLAAIMADVGALVAETKQKGAWVFNAGLTAPASATVVRVRDGKAMLTDGPFAETKEFLGGLLIVQAPDLDAALTWGEKLGRATTLPIEVRPFFGEG